MDDQQEIELARHVREGFDRFGKEVHELAPADLQVRDSPKRSQAEQFLRETLDPAKDLLKWEEGLVLQSEKHNEAMASLVAKVLLLLGVCGSAAGLVAGFGIARSVTRSIVELYVPIRAASGKLKEVIGPIDLVPSSGIENLDAILRKLADHIATVVNRLRESQLEVLRTEQLAALGQLAGGYGSRTPQSADGDQNADRIGHPTGAFVEPGLSRPGRDQRGDGPARTFGPDVPRVCPAAETGQTRRRRTAAIQETLDLIAARANRQRVASNRSCRPSRW